MKVLLFICALMHCSTLVFAQDYVLTVNGSSQQLDLNEETQIVLSDGMTLNVILTQQEFLSFESDSFRFKHHNAYKPSRTDLGDGILQTMFATPTGTGILVQEYDSMNPSGLIDLMLHELSKEEIEYGYSYEERPIKRKAGGMTFIGKEAVTSYKGDEWTRQALSAGTKDQGLLVITFIEKSNYVKESDVIDKMWETLEVLDR